MWSCSIHYNNTPIIETIILHTLGWENFHRSKLSHMKKKNIFYGLSGWESHPQMQMMPSSFKASWKLNGVSNIFMLVVDVKALELWCAASYSDYSWHVHGVHVWKPCASLRNKQQHVPSSGYQVWHPLFIFTSLPYLCTFLLSISVGCNLKIKGLYRSDSWPRVQTGG